MWRARSSLKINTMFGVAKAHGLTTTWSDKASGYVVRAPPILNERASQVNRIVHTCGACVASLRCTCCKSATTAITPMRHISLIGSAARADCQRPWPAERCCSLWRSAVLLSLTTFLQLCGSDWQSHVCCCGFFCCGFFEHYPRHLLTWPCTTAAFDSDTITPGSTTNMDDIYTPAYDYLVAKLDITQLIQCEPTAHNM